MKVKIQTMLGDIVVRLYDETPIHRDNFVKLVKDGYYDGTLFHRVIKDFMIQGGDPDSKGAPAGKMLGVGGPDYTLEAEIKDGLFHKRGALAAARQGDEVNPERRSSGSQFYIVWGQVYNEGQLRQFSKQLLKCRKYRMCLIRLHQNIELRLCRCVVTGIVRVYRNFKTNLQRKQKVG